MQTTIELRLGCLSEASASFQILDQNIQSLLGLLAKKQKRKINKTIKQIQRREEIDLKRY